MTAQPDLPLFASIETKDEFYPYVPHNGTDTSRAAADSMVPHVSDLEESIILLLQTRGGATCDELEMVTGLKHQTVSARLKGLADRCLIKDSGTQRKTRSGRAARVYVVCG